jgi:hypothetical protein
MDITRYVMCCCFCFVFCLSLSPDFLPFLPFLFLKWWQAIVNPGKWITTDESRAAGWYHSVMTIEPEQRPIWTSATLHIVCITEGPLITYKLFVHYKMRRLSVRTRVFVCLNFDFSLGTEACDWILL